MVLLSLTVLLQAVLRTQTSGTCVRWMVKVPLQLGTSYGGYARGARLVGCRSVLHAQRGQQEPVQAAHKNGEGEREAE